jgi:hypothetical protein
MKVPLILGVQMKKTKKGKLPPMKQKREVPVKKIKK